MLDDSRTAMLIGEEGTRLLAQKHVAVFGIGGVGGYACEALARAGVGALSLFDDDTVSPSNLNRQLVALHSTLGRPKAQVMAERIADINPGCHVQVHRVFYMPQNANDWPLDGYDYVIDAVDTVAAKLELAVRGQAAGVPVISAMGAGNKLHPEGFCVMDLYDTRMCPLARVMRRELKKRGVQRLRVVCSEEPPMKPEGGPDMAEAPQDAPQRPGRPKTYVPGSISFVPAAAGLVLAGAVVRSLLGMEA